MPIDMPKMFSFAAPPRTGVHWFIKACSEAGIQTSLKSFKIACNVSYLLWPAENEKNDLRISLVRHPCCWLRSVFDAFQAVRMNPFLNNAGLAHLQLYNFNDCPLTNFDEFVSWYLEKKAGEIGNIFNQYKADSRLRLEDMPWALVELLHAFGIEQHKLEQIVDVCAQARTISCSKWHPDLRQRVLESEIKLCQALDYY